MYSKAFRSNLPHIIAKVDLTREVYELIIPIDYFTHGKGPKTFLFLVKKLIEKGKVLVVELEIGVRGVVVFDLYNGTEAGFEVQDKSIWLCEVRNLGGAKPPVGKPLRWKVKGAEKGSKVGVNFGLVPKSEPFSAPSAVGVDEARHTFICLNLKQIIQNLVTGAQFE